MTDEQADGRGDWRDYLALSDAELLRQCETDRFRASGPGGQKRNKTDSAVRLRHLPTGLRGEATGSRSQHENRTAALGRLRRAIAQECRRPLPPAGFEAQALAPARSVTPQGAVRLRLGRRDGRYLPAIAELLDLLAGADWRLAGAAEALGCTTGELSRFIGRDGVLRERINRERVRAGHRALRPER